MDCPICIKKYSLHTYYYYESGLSEKGQKWIEKEIYEKSIALKNRAKALKENAIRLAKERYLPVLEDKFSRSNKKEVWESLKANIEGYKSLGTFYKHTKNQEKRLYLSKLFQDSDLASVMKVANAKDKEIERLLSDSTALNVEAEELLHS